MERKELWNEEAEAMPEEELRQLQLKKLQKQLQYCYDNSPDFYKKAFDEIKAHPGDIKSLDDFVQLPIMMDKKIERDSQRESLERFGHTFGLHLCADVNKVIGIASTSGTTGVPTFYGFTKHDIDVTNEVMARGLWRAGIRPGDTVLHGGGMSMWVAGLPVLRALQYMGARGVPVGAEARSERLLQMAELTRPKALFCTPSYAQYLAERAPDVIHKEVRELGIEILICLGEPGAGLPEVKKRLEEAYGAKLFDSMFGAWGMCSMSCADGVYRGMHIVYGDYRLDTLIDPSTQKPIPITNGARGELQITTLGWEATPVIKISLGDLNQIFTDPCPCGMPGYRRIVVGRVDDMLIVKGINVYPSAVKDIITSFAPRVTGEFRIILEQPPPLVPPPVKMKVEYGSQVELNELESLKNSITGTCSRLLRFNPEIELVPPGTLERSTKKGKILEKRYEL